MTTYDDFFLRYGSASNTAEGRIYYYIQRPDLLETTARIKNADDSAAYTIRECQQLIENLTQYRQELARRYGALETMSYKETLLLKRDRHYKGSVYFIIWNIKEFEDGTKQETRLKNYSGKERAQAIKDFEAMVKARPGVIAVKDIEKAKWER